MKKTFGLIGLASALALGGQAMAHPHWQHKDINNVIFKNVGAFEDVDANGDGTITRDEYLAFDGDDADSDTEWRTGHWDEMLDLYDDDKDGQLTVPEIEAGLEERVAIIKERVERFRDDMNGDVEYEFQFDGDPSEWGGKLEDLGKHLAEALKNLDHDGKLIFEYDGDGPHGMIYGRDDLPHPPAFAMMVPPFGMLGEADKDEDGKVTREEFESLHEKMFERLDKNGDGVLDEDEIGRDGHFAFKWIEREDDDN